MLQNAGFGTIPCGGGGVVANREPGTYICISHKKWLQHMFLEIQPVLALQVVEGCQE